MASDRDTQIELIAAALPEHGGDECTAHHSCLAYAASLYDAGLRVEPDAGAPRALAATGAALMHLTRARVLGPLHDGTFEECPADHCVRNRAALAIPSSDAGAAE